MRRKKKIEQQDLVQYRNNIATWHFSLPDSEYLLAEMSDILLINLHVPVESLITRNLQRYILNNIFSRN